MTAKFRSSTPRYLAVHAALTDAHAALQGGMQAHKYGLLLPAWAHSSWAHVKRKHKFARELPTKCSACTDAMRQRLTRCRPGFLDWPECACLAQCRCKTHLTYATSGMRLRFHVFARQLGVAEAEVQTQVCNMVRRRTCLPVHAATSERYALVHLCFYDARRNR